MLSWSRYTALLFAVGLGVGEAIINWGDWQFAPLWIVDYVIVVWLLVGFYQTRQGRNVPTLTGGWAFTAGVFYMALFVSLDPELKQQIKPDRTILILIALMLICAALGVVTSALAHRQRKSRFLESL